MKDWNCGAAVDAFITADARLDVLLLAICG